MYVPIPRPPFTPPPLPPSLKYSYLSYCKAAHHALVFPNFQLPFLYLCLVWTEVFRVLHLSRELGAHWGRNLTQRHRHQAHGRTPASELR